MTRRQWIESHKIKVMGTVDRFICHDDVFVEQKQNHPETNDHKAEMWGLHGNIWLISTELAQISTEDRIGTEEWFMLCKIYNIANLFNRT